MVSKIIGLQHSARAGHMKDLPNGHTSLPTPPYLSFLAMLWLWLKTISGCRCALFTAGDLGGRLRDGGCLQLSRGRPAERERARGERAERERGGGAGARALRDARSRLLCSPGERAR